ncbi:D-alanyl-D-alanine carboxypeptidase family protein [Roseovarius sp. 217]|jgi:D-alanyl-D-alanine carboxypeptidase (penicillin-binding protein 5/6)|uniref:D-alanyl-D-alanine carboxypeptidase family protein n=1 Tax=Roseovarius sp. (strain 217) TaxID=314264 RepID=UPI00006864BD|nr:D-alanyl-D-alanine carboxypeptidase family protein [Roseovarius sp. 217]EAQ23940.1 D-alanyl-D-alanine carboxypeptidase [Roseovarius sp. 217]
MILSRHIAAALLCLGVALPVQAFETSAKAAFVMDVTTGTVLLDKNADTALPPASMSKLMTLYVAFEAVRSGRLTLDERLPVSEHAMSYGGSTMFLDTTDRVRVEDLLRGIIVLSGNDACAVIAEALSPDGTEAGFARFMTQRAQQMGMTNSMFRNASGWPAEGHVMSVRDLALLARHIIEDFPDFYKMFAETEFRFDGRAPSNINNRNPLLGLGIGADGLKTGHTEQAGFGLTGSAIQGDRRVIFVISGLATTQDRARESEAIVNWAFRQFAQKSVLTAGDEVARADVWMGETTSVGLTVAEDVSTLLPVLDGGELKGEVVYTGPVRAPVAKGDVLAELVFAPEGLPKTRVPLVAAEDVPQGGFMTRIRTVSGVLLTRLQQGPEGAL